MNVIGTPIILRGWENERAMRSIAARVIAAMTEVCDIHHDHVLRHADLDVWHSHLLPHRALFATNLWSVSLLL